nr:MAG TPA: hypothetical protein [Caudoviricetes sp.]
MANKLTRVICCTKHRIYYSAACGVNFIRGEISAFKDFL